ncbi:MBL fold metallo-hydrolase [Pseudoduganella chitinolytica]|uniref:MBL fold metallo-hydrolase n=1 Tax=Pseudoduganella chitinolytica TaxID=34070 RepID=A0ABY8B6W9_9BURK|nr:MBL fold metallo-hydrolase [Pseudoduganella chitinolytica]WEF31681.1 MBL fold metallo-hydrolase [Pseudoduganella chitinolytica]
MKRLILLLETLLLLAVGGRAMAQQADTPPRHSLALPAAIAPASREDSVQFIGTATVLIRWQGMTIMTDPNFLHKGDHAHLGYGLTSERLTNPAIEFGALPPIDLVLLSHLHDDHFDRTVQEKLNRDIPIVTTPTAAGQLRNMGFRKVFGLQTWEALQVTKGTATLRLTAMPGRHGPLAVVPFLPTVMGTMLDLGGGGSRYRLYVSGDTMVYDDIEDIPRRFPGIDLALLHLGGTRLLGIVTVTMDAKEGVKMLRLIAPQRAIPIHYNDYTVFKSPLSDFQQAVEEAGLADKVSYLKHGESYRFEPRK